MSVEFSQLRVDDEAGMAQMLAIYREAIEPSEQKSPTELAGLLRDARYVFLVGRIGGRVSAFAIMFFPTTAEFWLLEYMAVDQGRRSAGLGAATFDAARLHATRRTPGLPCVLEVDRAGGEARPGNDVNARLRFYSRMRCRVIEGLDYILPLDKAGTPPPMMLLVHGLDGTNSLSKQTVRSWLETLYSQVYGQSADDQRIGDMIANMPDMIPLGFL